MIHNLFTKHRIFLVSRSLTHRIAIGRTNVLCFIRRCRDSPRLSNRLDADIRDRLLLHEGNLPLPARRGVRRPRFPRSDYRQPSPRAVRLHPNLRLNRCLPLPPAFRVCPLLLRSPSLLQKSSKDSVRLGRHYRRVCAYRLPGPFEQLSQDPHLRHRHQFLSRPRRYRHRDIPSRSRQDLSKRSSPTLWQPMPSSL